MICIPVYKMPIAALYVSKKIRHRIGIEILRMANQYQIIKLATYQELNYADTRPWGAKSVIHLGFIHGNIDMLSIEMQEVFVCQ